MPTDYLLFNHGVNTREARPQPTYADPLFELIQRYYAAPGRTLKKIALYWGNLNKTEEQKLLQAYQNSSIWPQLWFIDFREKQLLQFAGDAALYISRAVGSKVADALKEQALAGLQGYDPKEDRLHIVTHSMGTVILFDILFSAVGTRTISQAMPASKLSVLDCLACHPIQHKAFVSAAFPRWAHRSGSLVSWMSLRRRRRRRMPRATFSAPTILHRAWSSSWRPFTWMNKITLE